MAAPVSLDACEFANVVTVAAVPQAVMAVVAPCECMMAAAQAVAGVVMVTTAPQKVAAMAVHVAAPMAAYSSSRLLAIVRQVALMVVGDCPQGCSAGCSCCCYSRCYSVFRSRGCSSMVSAAAAGMVAVPRAKTSGAAGEHATELTGAHSRGDWNSSDRGSAAEAAGPGLSGSVVSGGV